MIEVRYSGGSSNSNPAASLGGVVSSVEVLEDEITFLSGQEIAGVTLLGGFGNQEDSSGGATLKLSIFDGKKYLVFCPYGVTPDTRQAPNYENMMTCLADGTYTLSWFTNFVKASIKFSLVLASLPGVDQTAGIAVSKTVENLLDSTSTNEATSGSINYRCVYVHNSFASPKKVSLYFTRLPLSGQGIGIGFDPIGVNGQAPVLANELATPVGVNFTTPRFIEDALIATLPAGQSIPVWIRRVVSAYQTITVGRDSASIIIEVNDP